MLLQQESRLPEWVQKCPVVLPGEELYLVGFYELDADRPIGPSGVGRIPRSAMVEWARDEGFEEEEIRRVVVPILRHIDDGMLREDDRKRRAEVESEKMRQRRKRAASKGARPRGGGSRRFGRRPRS